MGKQKVRDINQFQNNLRVMIRTLKSCSENIGLIVDVLAQDGGSGDGDSEKGDSEKVRIGAIMEWEKLIDNQIEVSGLLQGAAGGLGRVVGLLELKKRGDSLPADSPVDSGGDLDSSVDKEVDDGKD